MKFGLCNNTEGGFLLILKLHNSCIYVHCKVYSQSFYCLFNEGKQNRCNKWVSVWLIALFFKIWWLHNWIWVCYNFLSFTINKIGLQICCCRWCYGLCSDIKEMICPNNLDNDEMDTESSNKSTRIRFDSANETQATYIEIRPVSWINNWKIWLIF